MRPAIVLLLMFIGLASDLKAQGGPDHLPGHIQSGNPNGLVSGRFDSGAVAVGNNYDFSIGADPYSFDRYFFISSQERSDNGYYKEIFRIVKKEIEVGKRVYFQPELLETDGHKLILEGYDWYIDKDPLQRTDARSGLISQIDPTMERLFSNGKWADFHKVTLDNGSVVYLEEFVQNPESLGLVYVSEPFIIIVEDSKYRIEKRGILFVSNVSKIERSHRH